MKPAPTLKEILARCEREDDCWVWKLALSSDGRPIWHRQLKRTPLVVRRLVWELQNKQPMPSGRYACAGCETPGCVIHVQALNRSEQMHLASARGRVGGPQHAAPLAKTKRRASTKLTAEKAEAMRRKRTDGATYKALADEFGVHLSFAARVCNGTAWAPIGGASAFTFRP